MEKSIQSTLIKISQFLNRNRINFVLIGGLAASIRGRVRATEDIDLVLDCSVERAINLLESMDAESLGPYFPEVEEVVRRAFILPIEDKSNGVKLDLAIGISGFEQTVIARATPVTISNQEVAVATPEDLLLMKVLAGRPQDDQDIRGIIVANGRTMDWNYCIETATQLQAALDMDLVAKIIGFQRDARKQT